MPEDSVVLELTKDEALVLFEFLCRFTNTDILKMEDQAEARALWNLCALLERVLAEPFHSDYLELLSAARERLRDRES